MSANPARDLPIEGDIEDDIEQHLDIMLHWARRGIRYARKSGRLIGGSQDIVNSAVASYLRDRNKSDALPLSNHEEVWEALRQKLNRKIDTWKHRTRNLNNQAIKSADIADSNEASTWLGSFREDQDYAAQMKNCLEQAVQVIDEIEDEQLKEIAMLRLQCCTYAEISHELNLGLPRVRALMEDLRAWFRDLDLLPLDWKETS